MNTRGANNPARHFCSDKQVATGMMMGMMMMMMMMRQEYVWRNGMLYSMFVYECRQVNMCSSLA